jgi:hypothetical protein
MKTMRLGYRAFGMALPIAILAGCGGGSQTATLPTGGAIAPPAKTQGHSLIRHGATNGPLIYAVGGCDGTCVLSYPSGTYVTSIPAGGVAICSDTSGNVFFSQDSIVTEYAHGASSPTATFTLPGNAAAGCAVDPATNDLAVVFNGTAVKWAAANQLI